MEKRAFDSLKFLGYATLALQFLRAAQNTSAQLVRHNNAMSVVFGSEEQFDFDAFEETTMWSDFKVGIPTLFNLFHGIELTLKAFLSVNGTVPPHHKLTLLLNEFKRQFGDVALHSLIRKSVSSAESESPLARFLGENDLNIDEWYESLKYPETKKGKLVGHMALQYKGSTGVDFWRGVEVQAKAIRLNCLALARERGFAK